MRGILSLVLAMLLMVTMIPAQKVLAEGDPAGNPAGNSGNLTFQFANNSAEYGSVEWKDNDGNWHTQQNDGTVTATAVRVNCVSGGQLEPGAGLYLDGDNILKDKANKTALESEAGLALAPDKNYAFQHIVFIAAGGSGGGEQQPQPPQPPTTQGIELILEGNARDKFDEMIATGNDANNIAHEKGYACEFYLDAKEKKYMDECGAANFFGIKNNTYVTPKSTSILPSITNKSLMQLAEDLGMKVERRQIPEDELDSFEEAGACGTAAVISPISYIDDLDTGKRYNFGEKPGPISKHLYDTLRGIQYGTIEDKHGWTTVVIE